MKPVEAVRDFEPKLTFPLVPFDKIKVGTSRSYLVKGLIPREGLVVVWGPPKCGKTFWAFDVAMHIALGWEYRGRRVDAGPVVYIACEGERGLAARAEAFRWAKMQEENGDAPFFLLTTRLDLVGDADQLISDVRRQVSGGQCAAIVLDTLNRSLRGSESDDADMGAYVKAADMLREAFHCSVVVLHHCGVEGSRPRGHTSLTGAADAQIKVTRDGRDRVVTVVEWMKDGPEGAETVSRLEVVEVGTDEDGEPITSCVLTPSDEPAETAARRTKLSAPAKVALDLLKKAISECGEPAPPSNHVPAGVRVVNVEQWRRYAYAGGITDGETDSAKRKAFNRAMVALQAKQAVGVWDGFVWPIEADR